MFTTSASLKHRREGTGLCTHHKRIRRRPVLTRSLSKVVNSIGADASETRMFECDQFTEHIPGESTVNSWRTWASTPPANSLTPEETGSFRATAFHHRRLADKQLNRLDGLGRQAKQNDASDPKMRECSRKLSSLMTSRTSSLSVVSKGTHETAEPRHNSTVRVVQPMRTRSPDRPEWTLLIRRCSSALEIHRHIPVAMCSALTDLVQRSPPHLNVVDIFQADDSTRERVVHAPTTGGASKDGRRDEHGQCGFCKRGAPILSAFTVSACAGWPQLSEV